MEMRDEVKEDGRVDKGHGYMRVVPAIMAVIVLGLAVLVATVTLFLQRIPRLLRPDFPAAAPVLPSFGGELTLGPLLPGAILLVLVGIFVLLLVLVLCVCCCKCGGGSGLPFPRLPDLRGIAAILRGIAETLKETATLIDTTKGPINDAKGKLSAVTSFKVRKPRFKEVPDTHVEVPFVYSGPIIIPDGEEDVSPFDDETIQKLTTFANSVGLSALDGASATLRNKAGTLEEQANALDS